MNNPLAKLYSWQVSSGQLDGWTSYHLAAGLFIAKVAQWCGSSDLWAVLWVLIIGVLWEIFDTLTECLNQIFLRENATYFEIDAVVGEIYIDDGKEPPKAPPKIWDLYGEKGEE